MVAHLNYTDTELKTGQMLGKLATLSNYYSTQTRYHLSNDFSRLIATYNVL